jgi:hypothetical protein
MAIFKKSKQNQKASSKDGNLQAMVLNSSHICDAFVRNNCNGYKLNNDDWKTIWSSLFFAGARYMTSPASLEFTDKFIAESGVHQIVKSVNNIVKLSPDEKYFYQLSDQHQEWLDAVSKQIYEIAIEPLLNGTMEPVRQAIYIEVLPLVEHYLFQNQEKIDESQKAFSEIVASSISLAAEEIVLQAPIYGSEMTKSRYGAAQVYFAMAIFLFKMNK